MERALRLFSRGLVLLGAVWVAGCGSKATPPLPTVTPVVLAPVTLADLPPLPENLTSIEAKPAPAVISCEPVKGIIPFDYKSLDMMFGIWQLDYRSCDLSDLNLGRALDELLMFTFDNHTVWPAADKLPAEYDPQQVLAWGMSPGLGISQIHAQGVIGHGVGIALVDHHLLVDHVEYASQLRLYDEADGMPAEWPVVNDAPPYGAGRGTALASLLVGQKTGIAPGADLYYFGIPACRDSDRRVDHTCLAEGIRRAVAFNQQLPDEHKFRILVIPIDFRSGTRGYDETYSAVKEAIEAGILVLYPGSAEFKFLGMGRSPILDPDRFDSYGPTVLEARGYFDGAGGRYFDQLYIPTDARTLASPTGVSDYVFVRQGSRSESISFIAGMYALALQVKPDLTPDDFWSLSLKTGTEIKINYKDKNYTFGPMIDPAALIQALQAGK